MTREEISNLQTPCLLEADLKNWSKNSEHHCFTYIVKIGKTTKKQNGENIEVDLITSISISNIIPSVQSENHIDVVRIKMNTYNRVYWNDDGWSERSFHLSDNWAGLFDMIFNSSEIDVKII